jgi:hypothetical protein
VVLSFLLNSGCAIYEKETTNRGGDLDCILDEHWLKAESKAMRALRAFARFPWRASKGDCTAKLIGLLVLVGPRQFGRRIFD